MDMKKLGDRIRWARTQKGWTSADLVRESGVPQGTISKMENGRQDNVGKYGIKLQKALGVSMEWLATGAGDPEFKRTKHLLTHAHDPAPDNYVSFDSCIDAHQGNVNEHQVIQSYEYWKGIDSTETRSMSVPTEWLENERLEVDQLKSIEVPDDSQADRIRRGDWVAINVRWGGQLKNDKTYAIRIGGEYTLRRVAWQANGSLLLRCRNDEYPDEVIQAQDISSLDVLGQFARFQGNSP